MTKSTFESALQNLENAVTKLEEGSLSLEDSLRFFEQGVQWSRQCHQFLDKAEKRIDLILKNENGEHEQVEFKLED
ncbi:exodeoxyribonuclease VII small subunit [Deltaproteobacteria bacterium TL4]